MRDQIGTSADFHYLTFDRQDVRERAKRSPDLFIESLRSDGEGVTAIDEITKVPDVFDAIKLSVDESRRPGTFIISGSAQFSQKVGIRESLTGRIGLLRLLPLSARELHSMEFAERWGKLNFAPSRIPLAKIQQNIQSGGMPGVCFIRNASERREAVTGWIETTCYRDLLQVKGGRISGDLASEILHCLPSLESTDVTAIGRKLKVDVRRITNHVSALEAIFAIQRIDPHSEGVGKPRFYPVDCGFATALGASSGFATKMWVLNEILSQLENGSGTAKTRLSYYESKRHSHVDFVLTTPKETVGVVVTEEQTVTRYALRTGLAFLKHFPLAKMLYIAPVSESYKEDGVTIVPWNWIC